MRNIFLEKSYTNYGGESIPRPFSEKSKVSMSKVLCSLLLFVSIYIYIYILELSCRPLGFTSCKTFLKNRNKFGISLTVSFPAWFLKKDISLVIFY